MWGKGRRLGAIPHRKGKLLRVGPPHAEMQVEGRLLLDVVVRQRAAVLQLLAGKDQALLVWWDALLVLDLGLDVFDTSRSARPRA